MAEKGLEGSGVGACLFPGGFVKLVNGGADGAELRSRNSCDCHHTIKQCAVIELDCELSDIQSSEDFVQHLKTIFNLLLHLCTLIAAYVTHTSTLEASTEGATAEEKSKALRHLQRYSKEAWRHRRRE